VPGRDAARGGLPPRVVYNTVGADFFATLGTRLLRGRGFRPSDAGGPGVVVISDEMAREGWPQGDAVGQRLVVGSGSEARDYEIVGIAQNVMWNSLGEEPRPAMYFFAGSRPSGEMTLIVRTAGDEAGALPALRTVLKDLDPTMPTLQILTMDQHMRFALAGEEAVGVFGGALGLAGLLLASVGLYAVIAFFVSRRSREIGIRLALGATPGRVLRGVLGRALELTAVGTILGLAGALAAARGLSSSLYGIGRPDALSLLLCVLLVALVTAAASLLPARAASRTDPARTLRAS
jgi:hypothetical protein